MPILLGLDPETRRELTHQAPVAGAVQPVQRSLAVDLLEHVRQVARVVWGAVRGGDHRRDSRVVPFPGSSAARSESPAKAGGQ